MGGNAIAAMILSFRFFGGMGFFVGVVWWFIVTPLRRHSITAPPDDQCPRALRKRPRESTNTALLRAAKAAPLGVT